MTDAVLQVMQQVLKGPRPTARYLAGMALSGRQVMGLRDLLCGSVVRVMFTLDAI